MFSEACKLGCEGHRVEAQIDSPIASGNLCLRETVWWA
jgi:hypothetical protein